MYRLDDGFTDKTKKYFQNTIPIVNKFVSCDKIGLKYF